MNPIGADYSHWDGLVDWAQAKLSGISFAFCKATQGISFVDSQYARNNQEMKRVSILRGAYHYYLAAGDPINQARHFAANLIDIELPPVLDLEDTYNIPSNIASRVYSFLIELEKIVNKRPVIYTSSGFWNARMSPAIFWGDTYPLWVANYRSDAGPLVPLPWAPTNWTFWQFTKMGKASKYGSRKASVDLNVFNGSMAELRDFCGLPGGPTETISTKSIPSITYRIPVEQFTQTNSYVVRN